MNTINPKSLEEIKHSVSKSVLCWLATSSGKNIPNVSPKEIFAIYKDQYLIIANVASPQSVRNIGENKNVCVSLIDILIQKGQQIKGTAELVNSSHVDFSGMEKILLGMTGGKFPFKTVFKIKMESVKPIIAPRYILFPETSEEEQIERARKQYNL